MKYVFNMYFDTEDQRLVSQTCQPSNQTDVVVAIAMKIDSLPGNTDHIHIVPKEGFSNGTDSI